ncbi:hypothetical protein SS50377_21299 [Spironucleus salmonicida]|uniref:Uncharacterized protein n=1 Tax=Spironucleus salmonicida TaxID=348837 RepID=A0A9P8S043_9EUKA|nr:hypothetical protein SS50377_21299 [Spironucleus salmonicida]
MKSSILENQDFPAILFPLPPPVSPRAVFPKPEIPPTAHLHFTCHLPQLKCPHFHKPHPSSSLKSILQSKFPLQYPSQSYPNPPPLPNSHIFTCPVRSQISRFRAAHANFAPNKFPSVQNSLSRSRDSMQLWTKFPLKFHESINFKSVQSAIVQSSQPYRLGHLDDAAFKLLRIGLQGALDLLLVVSGMMKQ